jgi:hypothetical protein
MVKGTKVNQITVGGVTISIWSATEPPNPTDPPMAHHDSFHGTHSLDYYTFAVTQANSIQITITQSTPGSTSSIAQISEISVFSNQT